MKRFQIMGVSLFAVLAFCVVGVTSAGATTVTLLAEWLVGGNPVTTALAALATGKMLLEDTNAEKLGIKAAVECEAIVRGTIGPNGTGEITSLLNAAGTAEISKTALTGTALECKTETNCEGTSKVWPVHLPWRGLLELVEQTGSPAFFAGMSTSGTGGSPGWYIECTILGVKATDECLANPQAAGEAVNVATGVEGIDSLAFTELMGLKLGLCSSSGEETAVLEGKGIGKLETGTEILSVSSTG